MTRRPPQCRRLRRRLVGMFTSTGSRDARPYSGGPETSRALAEHMVTIADTLAHAVAHAAMLDLPVPAPISNAVHDLRGWAARLHHPGSARPTGVNAARMIAYIRNLPDHQLLALLADLPWARLDALLDATAEPNPEPLDYPTLPDDEPDPNGRPSDTRRR